LSDREKDPKWSGYKGYTGARWSYLNRDEASIVNRNTYSEEDSFSVEHSVNAYGNLIFELKYYDKHYNDIVDIINSLEASGFPPFTYRMSTGGEVSTLPPHSPELRNSFIILDFGKADDISVPQIKEIFNYIKNKAELHFDPIWFGGQVSTKRYKM